MIKKKKSLKNLKLLFQNKSYQNNIFEKKIEKIIIYRIIFFYKEESSLLGKNFFFEYGAFSF